MATVMARAVRLYRPQCAPLLVQRGSQRLPRLLLRTSARIPPPASMTELLVKPALFCSALTVGSFGVAAWVRAGTEVDRIRGRFFQRMRQGSNSLSQWWASIPTAKRVVGCFAASYITVFALWKVPRLHRFMMRHFMHHPYEGHLSQYVGCHFSHMTLMHLGFNTMALWSFGVPMVERLGTEQFLAFSVGAGMCASLASQLHSVAVGNRIPGLGASGVIMGLVGAFALTHPDAVIYVPFLPFIQGPAVAAFGLLMAVDIAGIAMGWRVLGHAAHLGGQLFGAAYVLGGHSLLFSKPLHVFANLRLNGQ